MIYRRRNGFTLIELLVVIFIIGIATALLIPAIQAARETARRATCASRLKNIGLAIGNHATTKNTFPAGLSQNPPGFSYIVQILPYIEQVNLYNAINFSIDADVNANLAVSQQSPSMFLCPSDTARSNSESANAINYSANAGISSINGEGVFIGRPISPRDITDGLSQTVGVAEWIVGSGTREKASRMGSSYRLTGLYTNSPSDFDAFVRDCNALNPANIRQFSAFKGQFWLEGNLCYTLYNHTLPPNQPSCVADQNRDAATAGSFHSGGAQVVTMDGGVHFIKDSINPRVWSAVGTRARGELVDGSQF